MCETERWLGGARGPGVSGCDDTLVSGKNKRDGRPGRSRAGGSERREPGTDGDAARSNSGAAGEAHWFPST